MREGVGMARLGELAAQVDADFEAIRRRQAQRMQCRSGCSACCRARLSVTRVEEAFLRRGLDALPDAARADMARQALDLKREMCPALDDGGRCRVYAARPLICRSYGVALRRRREVELVNPPVIDVCDLNFVDTPLKTLAAKDVFDQTRLEAEVATIDDVYCAENGLPRGERVPLAQILA